MAREGLDSSVDRVPVGDHCADQLASEYGGFLVSFGLSEVAFQDRAGGPLAELGLEDRGERQPSSGPLRPLSVGGASHGSALGAHTVDDDGDALRLHSEQPLDGGAHGRPDVGSQRHDWMAGTCDDRHANAPVVHPGADGPAREQPPSRWPGVPDTLNAGHLERGQSDHLADNSPADGQVVAGHRSAIPPGAVAAVAVGAAASSAAWESTLPSEAADVGAPRRASVMRSGTRLRAVSAPTSIA